MGWLKPKNHLTLLSLLLRTVSQWTPPQPSIVQSRGHPLTLSSPVDTSQQSNVQSRRHPLTLSSPVDTPSTVQLSSPEDAHSHCPAQWTPPSTVQLSSPEDTNSHYPAQWTPPQQSNCPVQRTPTHTVHRPAESPLAGSLIYELVEGG
jgi:hypothetical protein